MFIAFALKHFLLRCDSFLSFNFKIDILISPVCECCLQQVVTGGQVVDGLGYYCSTSSIVCIKHIISIA